MVGLVTRNVSAAAPFYEKYQEILGIKQFEHHPGLFPHLKKTARLKREEGTD